MQTSSSNTLLTLESKALSRLLPAIWLMVISGLLTYVIPGNATWMQWCYLLHVFSGVLAAIPLFIYLSKHFKRTLGQKRPFMTTSGVVIVFALLFVFAGGVHISIYGQTEANRWIYESHVVAAFLILALLALHILAHHFFLPQKRKGDQRWHFNTIFPSTGKNILATTVIAGVVIGGATILYELFSPQYIDDAVISPYELPYGEHPFRPSQTESFTGGFMDVRRLANSDKCGTCHTAITEEWKASMHAQAASDKSYQTNITLLAEKKGMAATRYCEGCHAPIALLSGELTKGGRLDTHGHMMEGIGCMGCHGVDQIVNMKGVASYRSAPKDDYLFANSDNAFATKLHNYLVKIQPRAHRTDMNRPVIFQPEFCSTCHTQFMDKDVNNWGWVKMQDEYADWLNSPYSGQSAHEFSGSERITCQDCHFPKQALNDPSADSNGLSSSHRSLGANTAIPYYTGDKKQLALTRQFLQSDKIRLSIEKPNREDATYSEKFITPAISSTQEAPAYYYLGESADINLIVSNANVGHNFPGGTTDINEVWVHFNVTDSQNQTIYESGAIDEENNVDASAQFYRSLAVDRYGKHVWKHDLFNMVGTSYQKIIRAGESDIVNYRFDIPSWAKSPITVSAVVRYRKFNNRYARWALKDEHIELPIVDMARDAITIPIRIRPEVEE